MLFEYNQISRECQQVLALINDLHLQLRFQLQQAPRRWTGLLARTTRALAVQGSNSIEGFNVSIEDAVAAVEGEEPLDEKTEAWKAVSGNREAMTYVLQVADDPQFVHHEMVLRSMHFMMTRYDMAANPGRWRPGPVFVQNELTRATEYEAPDVTDVPALMSELVTALNHPGDAPVMIRAALAHLNLVMIHPFSDGNGRMSRALQTLVLARSRIVDPTFSSIEEYLGLHHREYYQVLAEVGRGHWSPANDTTSWIRFCLTAHYRQAATTLRRIRETQHRGALIEDELRRRGLNERMYAALADAVGGQRIRNTTYRTAAAINEAIATRDLSQLAAAGLLVARGERRGRFYEAGDWLLKLRHETAEPLVENDPFAQE